jgi:hypothetical protein
MWGITKACERRRCARGGSDKRRQKARRQQCTVNGYGGYVDEPETSSSNQSHDDQAVLNVTARLQCVVPEIECLRDMPAKTNQQKKKCTEFKKVSPHFTL